MKIAIKQIGLSVAQTSPVFHVSAQVPGRNSTFRQSWREVAAHATFSPRAQENVWNLSDANSLSGYGFLHNSLYIQNGTMKWTKKLIKSTSLWLINGLTLMLIALFVMKTDNMHSVRVVVSIICLVFMCLSKCNSTLLLLQFIRFLGFSSQHFLLNNNYYYYLFW